MNGDPSSHCTEVHIRATVNAEESRTQDGIPLCPSHRIERRCMKR